MAIRYKISKKGVVYPIWIITNEGLGTHRSLQKFSASLGPEKKVLAMPRLPQG